MCMCMSAFVVLIIPAHCNPALCNNYTCKYRYMCMRCLCCTTLMKLKQYCLHLHTLVHVCTWVCCVALFVCLTLLASFFLPSHLSFKKHVYTFCTLHVYMYIYEFSFPCCFFVTQIFPLSVCTLSVSPRINEKEGRGGGGGGCTECEIVFRRRVYVHTPFIL